jgi:hypothetical protein
LCKFFEPGDPFVGNIRIKSDGEVCEDLSAAAAWVVHFPGEGSPPQAFNRSGSSPDKSISHFKQRRKGMQRHNSMETPNQSKLTAPNTPTRVNHWPTTA